MKIGHGGASPFYGLFELNGSDPENITDLEQIKKPFRWTDATNPMQWQNAETEDGVLIDSDGNAGESLSVWLLVLGALYLCNYGCALLSPQPGEVWMDRQAEGNGITPERGEDGSKLRFLPWYEKWLDRGDFEI